MTTVAFIGLGIMGGPMAANLVKAGFEVDRLQPRPETVEAWSTPAARCRPRRRGRPRAPTSIAVMVPDSPDVEAVLAGEDGVFANAPAGTLDHRLLHASAPTSPSRWPRQAASAGFRVLDAPVSGGEAGAIEASAVDHGRRRAPTTSTTAKPILEAVGKTIVHVGPERLRPDRQGGQPADRRRQHPAARRGGRLPRGLRRRHRGRAGGARRRPGRLAPCWTRRRRTCWTATSSPASGSTCTTRTWASSPRAAREAGVVIPLGAVVAQLMALRARQRRRRPRPLRAAARRRAAVRPQLSGDVDDRLE